MPRSTRKPFVRWAVATAAALAVTAPAADAAITLRVGTQVSQVSSFSQKSTNPSRVVSGTQTPTGFTQGRGAFGPMKIERAVDAQSVDFLKAQSLGTPITQPIEVNFTNGPFSMSYCLQNTIVTSIRHSADAGDGSVLEEIEFRSTRIGMRVGPAVFAFDQTILRDIAPLC